MLRDKVEGIIKKNRIDAIYAKDGVFMNWAEVREDFACNYTEILGEQINELQLAIYPGGNLGKQIADILSACSCRVECIIDNHAQDKEYMGIPIFSYEEWLDNHCTEAVLLCSQKPGGDVFYNQLILDGYSGKIVDVYKCLKSAYHNLEQIPLPNGDMSKITHRWGYMYINELELKYADAKGMEKAELLRLLIYSLFVVRDFCYTEKYIEEIETSEDCRRYKKTIEEIKDAINRVVGNPEIENVMFIHIIDALPDSQIERMPVLGKIAEEGIRVKGLTVQYPITHYALNTMFTGKSVFDIELGKEEIQWDDSKLLQFLEEKQIMVDFLSPVTNKIKTEDLTHFNKKNCKAMIAGIMFEGLCCLEDMPQNHLIVLHSLDEVHPPFWSLGIGKKLKSEKQDKFTEDELHFQYNYALSYVDKQIDWYFSFFQATGYPNLVMGDHGGFVESFYNLYWGIKKDLGYNNKDYLSPAFIISGLEKGKVVKGMISNTSLPDILLDILKFKTEHISLLWEKYFREYVFLQAVPEYSKYLINKDIPRGMYGLYEGHIGVMTPEEIYLLSASGRELYLRPDEHQYRNVVKMDAYQDDVRRCRRLLGESTEYPMEIYRLEKYKAHLEMLEQYDPEGFRKIMDKLSEVLE